MRGIKAKQLRRAAKTLKTDNERAAYRQLKKLYRTDHTNRKQFNAANQSS